MEPADITSACGQYQNNYQTQNKQNRVIFQYSPNHESINICNQTDQGGTVFSNVMLRTRIEPVLKLVIMKIINIKLKNGQKIL
jgi:hypothetical protein